MHGAVNQGVEALWGNKPGYGSAGCEIINFWVWNYHYPKYTIGRFNHLIGNIRCINTRQTGTVLIMEGLSSVRQLYGIFALSISAIMGIFRNGAILHVACTIGSWETIHHTHGLWHLRRRAQTHTPKHPFGVLPCTHATAEALVFAQCMPTCFCTMHARSLCTMHARLLCTMHTDCFCTMHPHLAAG